MAEFSKEFGFDWYDFSIAEEFDKLKDGYYLSLICEGFGFIGITRDGDTCEVLFHLPDGSECWREFDFETNSVINSPIATA